MRALSRRTGIFISTPGLLWSALACAQPVPNFSSQPAVPAIFSTAASITPAPTLKYRDPSKLMTIGELSDLQAARASAEYLAKFGYTDQKAAPARPQTADKSAAQRKYISVYVLAGWSRASKSQVEALVDGRFTTLTGGETLAPGVVVEEVRPPMLVLSVRSRPSGPASRDKQSLEVRLYSLRVGAQSEIDL